MSLGRTRRANVKTSDAERIPQGAGADAFPHDVDARRNNFLDGCSNLPAVDESKIGADVAHPLKMGLRPVRSYDRDATVFRMGDCRERDRRRTTTDQQRLDGTDRQHLVERAGRSDIRLRQRGERFP
ncbi:hypothetical protein WS78_16675 [Burkholderia savannae]|nr:hypothetical protein WS78_16675 [Burkholderia savannae]